MRTIEKDKIHNILVVRTDRMGEALLNIPAIRALKQTFKCRIYALVSASIQDLLKGLPEIDQILPFDEGNWNKNIFNRLNLWRKIRKAKFDLAVILNPSKRFHVLTYLTGIPRRLGYNRKWGFLLTHKIEDKKFQGQKHEVEYNLDLVRTIGAETKDLHISLAVDKRDEQFIKELLAKYAVADKDLIIAIHPQSSNPAKCWPKEYFAEVIEQLNRRFPVRAAIIAQAEERDSLSELLSLTKQPLIDLSGKLTLKQLAAFLQRCALLISNDSGPVHIAQAIGIPTIVIFGRNIRGVSPKRWGPWGNGHIVLHKDPGCSPCLDRNCHYEFKCLTSITPEEVLLAVEQRLAQSLQLKARRETK